jgi:hypothetical protein
MVTAVEAQPGTDPDRASFTTALEAARDQLTAARGICPDGPADLPGNIGRAVLSTLLAARRPRYSARKVKCATSRYLNRETGRPAASTAITAIDVTVHAPPPEAARHGHRGHRPHRAWNGKDIAAQLQVRPRNVLTQLGEWASLGFLTRTGKGTYALAAPP